MAARQPGKRPTPAAKARTPAKVVRPPVRLATAGLPPRIAATLDVLRESARGPGSHQSKREWSNWIRRVAAQVVINDDIERSVVHWWRESFSDLVEQSTFCKWAVSDRWLAQRQERLEKFREAVERQIGTDNVRAFVEDLRKLDAIHTDLAQKIQGDGNAFEVVDADSKKRTLVVVPTQFEKRSEAITALVALDRRRDDKRKGVLGGLPAALGTGGGELQPVAVNLGLSPAVARAMAKAKMLAERAETAQVEEGGEHDDEG
jgi:hypothetical protein